MKYLYLLLIFAVLSCSPKLSFNKVVITNIDSIGYDICYTGESILDTVVIKSNPILKGSKNDTIVINKKYYIQFFKSNYIDCNIKDTILIRLTSDNEIKIMKILNNH